MPTIKSDRFIRAGSRDTPYVPNIQSERNRPMSQNPIANRGVADQAVHGRIKPGDRVIVCMIPEFKAEVVSVHLWCRDVFVAVVRTREMPSLLLMNREIPVDQATNLRSGKRASVEMRVTVDRLVHDKAASPKAKTPRK